MTKVFKPCRILACQFDAEAKGLCKIHYSRAKQGINLDLPITPGRRGPKPKVPGIPQELRDANARCSRIGWLNATPEDRALAKVYVKMVTEHRKSQKAWKEKWGDLLD